MISIYFKFYIKLFSTRRLDLIDLFLCLYKYTKKNIKRKKKNLGSYTCNSEKDFGSKNLKVSQSVYFIIVKTSYFYSYSCMYITLSST